MDSAKPTTTTIDAYILEFPPNIQEILQHIRKTIQDAAPEAEEKIAYRLPTFTLHGNLVHFGAFKQHIGFYPAPSAIEKFQDRLANYKMSKGAIQFSLEAPIPYELIREIVLFRVQENLEIAATKTQKK